MRAWTVVSPSSASSLSARLASRVARRDSWPRISGADLGAGRRYLTSKQVLNLDLSAMLPQDHVSEVPLPCVLDATDSDQLLDKLRAVHGEPRFDIALELVATRRRARLKP
jgi:hypothetical protein